VVLISSLTENGCFHFGQPFLFASRRDVMFYFAQIYPVESRTATKG
jgi:hypothetical protein